MAELTHPQKQALVALARETKKLFKSGFKPEDAWVPSTWIAKKRGVGRALVAAGLADAQSHTSVDRGREGISAYGQDRYRTELHLRLTPDGAKHAVHFAGQAADAAKMSPDQYRAKHGECPHGFRWDGKSCVKKAAAEARTPVGGALAEMRRLADLG